jgi:hypothetical protein
MLGQLIRYIKKNVKKITLYKNLNTKKIFTSIKQKNLWGDAESVSGPGSTIDQTKILVAELSNLFIAKNIKSLLDIPCGDFNWMQTVDLSNPAGSIATCDARLKLDGIVVKFMPGAADSNALAVMIDYASAGEGTFQCFYTLEEGEDYSEERAFRLNVNSSGTLSFVIPCTEHTRIMFDFPDRADFTIKGARYAAIERQV